MKNLTREQLIQKLNELLGENVQQQLKEQEKYAGEHGDPTIVVSNSKGKSVDIEIDWDKEADILSYTIMEDDG